jgi:hypothetical protein
MRLQKKADLQGSRYSVPWSFAGKQVWVREQGQEVETHYGSERIAVHAAARGRHQVVTRNERPSLCLGGPPAISRFNRRGPAGQFRVIAGVRMASE